MKVIVEESCDSVTILVDGKTSGQWRHDQTHEEMFKDLFAKLEIDFEYEEVY